MNLDQPKKLKGNGLQTLRKRNDIGSFKEGHLIEENGFVDKHNLMPQSFTPRGISDRSWRKFSQVRCFCCTRSYQCLLHINIGAFVDEGTMVDSHALVGSCAQIGKRVHLSAGVQIGGVLEPIGLTPVVIEDDAFIGAGSVIVEGIQIGSRAVIAPGVSLSKGVPVYDCINERLLEKGAPIPSNAVVVPGSRPINSKKPWAKEQGLALNCALIIKYRDEKSDTSLELESLLR